MQNHLIQAFSIFFAGLLSGFLLALMLVLASLILCFGTDQWRDRRRIRSAHRKLHFVDRRFEHDNDKVE